MAYNYNSALPPTISDAILEINSSARMVVDDNDINQIRWVDGTSPIPKTTIEAKKAEMLSTWNAKNYSRQRRETYTVLREQLDMLWHDIDDGKLGDDAKTGQFYTAIKTIKDQYPKP